MFDTEASLQPEHTITVYSLYDSPNIRQSITAFQGRHSDVMVEYETGMTGKDAVTRSDALKTLNTNIMAGEGPDVDVYKRQSSVYRCGLLLWQALNTCAIPG